MHSPAIDLRDRNDVVLDGRRVCIVDDDELYRAHVSILLGQKNLRVLESANTRELQDLLDRDMPDCILLDYDLDSENGLFIVDRLRQRYASLAPIIMVSADETQRTAVRAFRAGVADFLTKRGLRQDDLTQAVRRAIGLRARDEARVEEMERLRRHVRFDAQTGLLTRSALDERLTLALESAHRHGRPCGMAGFRLVRLGEVQDRFGVVAADRVLRVCGQRLREQVRATDLCGLWERGTFVVIVDSDASAATLRTFVDRVLASLAVEVDLAAAHLCLTAVGASVLSPEDGDTVERLSARFDERLAWAVAEFGDASPGSTEWLRLPDPPQTQTEGDGRERRREPRIRTLKQGRIYLDGLQSTINCTVRNVSTGGARLRLEAPMAIPEFFRLRISDTGVIRRVRKCWHLNNELGVEFQSG